MGDHGQVGDCDYHSDGDKEGDDVLAGVAASYRNIIYQVDIDDVILGGIIGFRR